VNTELQISAEIVYATEDRQEILKVQLARGATVADAIAASNLKCLFPGESLDSCTTGIWGRVVERTRVLSNGDRVELYRPLQKDPRIARRERAATDG